MGEVREVNFVPEDGIGEGGVEVGLEARGDVVRQRLSITPCISIFSEVYAVRTYGNRGETSSQACLGTITRVIPLRPLRSAIAYPAIHELL
jgi:hypothetical protein